jgi:hypothetical protein
MRRFGQLVASAVISASLIASSTAAVASTNSLPAAPSADGWVALSMLTPSGTAVLGSTGLAAAQPDSVPPPPPPPTYTGPGTPPIPVIILWLAVLGTMIYIATKGNHHHPVPNSPA